MALWIEYNAVDRAHLYAGGYSVVPNTFGTTVRIDLVTDMP
jgi:hypothetical protein